MASLRRRLVAAAAGAVLVAWGATAWFSYLDARARIGAMLDAHLQQAAELLLATAGIEPTTPVAAPAHRHGRDSGWTLAWQIRRTDGRLLHRSADAPETPFAVPAAGFNDFTRDGSRWRAYGAVDAARGLEAQVAERYAFRDQLAGSVASHLLHPVAIAVPALALAIWIAVAWGLRPLGAFARLLAARDPADLEPIDAGRAPDEIRPLAAALNDLLVRMAALLERERRFTADAAHELRTPLAAIRAHAELARDARDPEAQALAAGRVVEATGRAARLVEQLLLLARLDAELGLPATMPVRLADIAAAAVADAAPRAAEKGIDLGMAEDTDRAARVAGDADLLAALARNLVDNAVRYTPAGGRVDVAVRRAEGRWRLEVIDTGPGIPPAERTRVPGRFHRIAGSGEEGSGLGLSIVARIAELHGATLALADGPGGRGLAATVTFPAAVLSGA